MFVNGAGEKLVMAEVLTEFLLVVFFAIFKKISKPVHGRHTIRILRGEPNVSSLSIVPVNTQTSRKPRQSTSTCPYKNEQI